MAARVSVPLEPGTRVEWSNEMGVIKYIDDNVCLVSFDERGHVTFTLKDFFAAYESGSLLLHPKHQPTEPPIYIPTPEQEIQFAHWEKYFLHLDQQEHSGSKVTLQETLDHFTDPENENKIPDKYVIKSVSTLDRRYREWRQAGRDMSCFVGKKRKSKTSKFTQEVMDLVEEVLTSHYLSKQAPSKLQVYGRLKEAYAKKAITGSLPSQSQFYNLVNALDPYEVKLAREGKEAARRFAEITEGVIHADFPLQYVEIDAVHLNIGIVCPHSGEFLGTLIIYVAIDRCTRCVLGYSTSLKKKGGEGETTTAVLACIEHSILPKPLSNKRKPWSQFGAFHFLICDAGSAFNNSEVATRLAELTVSARLVTPTKKPKKKPFVERFFRTLREQFAMNLPGYIPKRLSGTPSDFNVKQIACMTMDEVKDVLEYYITNIYHETSHRGLQDFTPNQMWSAHASAPSLPAHYTRSVRSLGKRLEGVIQNKNGIQKNKLRYMNRDLFDLFKEMTGNREKPKNPKVEFLYDEEDISRILVIHPKTQYAIEVPCTNSSVRSGTSLAQWLKGYPAVKPKDASGLSIDHPTINDAKERQASTSNTLNKKHVPDPTPAGKQSADDTMAVIQSRNAALGQFTEESYGDAPQAEDDGFGESLVDYEDLDDFEVE